MSHQDFPEHGSFQDKLTFLLQFAVLAPSAHNNQPWQVRWNASLTEASVSVDPEFNVMGGTPRLTIITLGVFIENLLEAAAHFNVALHISPVPMSAQVLSLNLTITEGSEVPPAQPVAFSGLERRHTNRGLYHTEPLSQEAMDALTAVEPEPGAQVTFVTDQADRELGGKLAAAGMRIALSLPPLRSELAHFVHFAQENSPTGMLAEAMVAGAAPTEDCSSGEQWALHKLPLTEEVALCREKFATAPLQVIISTTKDSFRDQFAAGRTMERILNVAGSLGLTHCIAAAATEVPILGPHIRTMSKSSAKPQLFFRLGIPQKPEFTIASPRRSVEQITKQQ
ncbi:nitroreductase family protein [soil metagenome]